MLSWDKHMTLVNIERYNGGCLLTNRKVKTFRVLGLGFIPKNLKRKNKFSFDDPLWSASPISFLAKIKLVLSGEFKIAKDSKKSIARGVL